jgi:hypothetical protein
MMAQAPAAFTWYPPTQAVQAPFALYALQKEIGAEQDCPAAMYPETHVAQYPSEV